MTYVPRNGAPLNNKEGWQDNSVRELVREPTGDPIHKPLIFTFGQRSVGNEAFPLVGDNALSMLGRKLFDYRSPYATFNTPFQAMFNQNANECMYQRLIPDDAKTATHRLFADVLETKVPQYERDEATGAIVYNAAGQPKVKAQIDGLLIVFRVLEINSALGEYGVGLITEGALTGDDGKKSKLYPIWDIKAPYAGADCNGFGYKFIPLSAKSSPQLQAAYQNTVGSRVYSMQWVETLEGVTSPVIWKTLGGVNNIQFSLKPDAYYQPLKTELDFEYVVPEAYRKTSPDIGGLPKYGPFEGFHLYRDNIQTILKLAQAKIPNAPDNEWMIDIFGGVDVNGYVYDGLQINPATEINKASFGSSNIHYLQGGSDGTMNNDVYDELVRREMLLFPDRGQVRYDNELKYGLGVFWDSGFSFDTKQAMTKFIAGSRNTFLGLCTHVYNQGRNDEQAEESAKVALNEMITAIPESDRFGTPAARGLIAGQSAFLRTSTYKKPVPMIYSIANFFSKYMGSKEGMCKPAFRFNRGSKTEITDLVDLSMPWKGNEVYASDWDVSLITARSKDYYRLFIPAMKSIYNNDGSVLNGALFNLTLTYAYRVTDMVWSDTTGEDRMTREELAKDIENNIIARLANRLDGIVDIVPNVYFTAEDIASGNSVTVDLLCYGGVLLTQFNTTIKSYRRE